MSRKPPGAYGIDAPQVSAGLGIAGIALLAGGLTWLAATGSAWALLPLLYGVFMTASAAVYLHTTLRGKFAVWADILDGLELRGDERVVDLGCGRGMVLMQVAQRLKTGTAIGVDL